MRPAALLITLALAIFALLYAYNRARPDELPWRVAIITAAQPVPHTPPQILTVATLKPGFATEADCMGPEGAADPKFKKSIEDMATNVTKKTGVKIIVNVGCLDMTKKSESF